MATLTKPFYHEPYPVGYQAPINQLDEVYPFDQFKGTNARQIIKSKMDSFLKNPSMAKAQELEDYGITADYSDSDAGEPPVAYNQL